MLPATGGMGSMLLVPYTLWSCTCRCCSAVSLGPVRPRLLMPVLSPRSPTPTTAAAQLLLLPPVFLRLCCVHQLERTRPACTHDLHPTRKKEDPVRPTTVLQTAAVVASRYSHTQEAHAWHGGIVGTHRPIPTAAVVGDVQLRSV